MISDNTMNSPPSHSVEFGKIARTIIYKDTEGGLCFCFDVAPSTDLTKGKWIMFLGAQPLSEDGKRTPIEIPAERVKLAFERTKAYATSCGYHVEIDSN